MKCICVHFQSGLDEGRQTMNLLANLQERLVQSEQGPVLLGTPTTSNTGILAVEQMRVFDDNLRISFVISL